jgi:CDP-6-deoxy-D-xylo-4-hexulose-3-dehydrase
MKYPLACDTWDDREIEAIQKVIESGRYTMGPHVKKFEEEFARYFKCEDAVMVNSGSSANLLILAALAEKYKLRGNIIVPAVSWSTTYFPLHQYNFTMNFVDIDRHTLNIDPEKIQASITPETCAIFAVNLLGNSCKYKILKKIAEQNSLMLIEDNCESLGSITDTQEYAGTVGQFGSYSFFYSHHLQTMEGGMIVCKNTDDADFIRSMRAHGWSRDLTEDNTIYKKSGNKFKDSFTFITPGYSLRPLEMSGAIGSVQLNKWPEMRQKRLKNAKYFNERFADLPVSTQKEIGESSWFGFSMVLENKLAGQRNQVVQNLESKGIECRPIVAGNFMKNPVIEYLNFISKGNYESANQIHDNGLFIGNDIRDLKENIDLVHETIKKVHSKL